LEAVKNQTYKNVEIIVVDSYSTDGTDKIARKYGEVIHTKKEGPGAARNAAVKKSTGDIVAFTDADTIVPPDWAGRISQNFSEDPKIIGVGGILRPSSNRIRDDILFTLFHNIIFRIWAFIGFYAFSTTNCAYRKDAFLKVGGFNESISMIEDNELAIKMEKIGKLKIDKELVVRVSIRRLKQRGYIIVFLKYIKAYLCYFTRRPIRSKYFEIIEH